MIIKDFSLFNLQSKMHKLLKPSASACFTQSPLFESHFDNRWAINDVNVKYLC